MFLVTYRRDPSCTARAAGSFRLPCSSPPLLRSPRAEAATRRLPPQATTGDNTEKVTLRLGYFPNVTHAPAIIGVQDGIFAKALGDNVDLEALGLQLGNRGDDRDPRRRARRELRRPEPGDQRIPEVGRQAHPHRCGRRVGWCVPRREAFDHERRRPQGQEARDAAARQHARRRVACVPEGRRASRPTSEGGGDVSILPQDNSRP